MRKASNSLTDLTWAGDRVLNRQEISLDEIQLESVISFSCLKHNGLDGFWLRGVVTTWCTKGRMRIVLDDGTDLVLSEGDFALFYPGHMAKLEGLDDTNTLTRMILSGSLVEDWFDQLGFYDGFIGREPVSALNLDIIKSANKQVQDATIDNKRAKNALLLRLIYNYLVSIHERIRRQSSFILFDAIKYLNADLASGTVTVKNVAAALQVSTNTIHLAFAKTSFGSPGAYLTRRRLRIARHLLIDTRLTIKEIAARCGFQTASHFTTFIRKHLGKTPRELRR